MLAPFTTRTLLPLTAVSHRFHDLILRILQHRLIETASLRDHKLILEVYHPSSKLSTPYLLCDYLGTDGITNDTEGEDFLYKDVGKTGKLGKLFGLYSHFRPVQPGEDRKAIRPHPAGSWLPGPSNGLSEEQDLEFVCQNVNLESHELFSQLCTVTNLVKVGPKRGLFLSYVNIGDDVTRIWRDWLAERATLWKSLSSGLVPEDEEYQKRLLWADKGKNVGLRFRVFEKADTPIPILLAHDEDPPVSYTLQYEGKVQPIPYTIEFRVACLTLQ